MMKKKNTKQKASIKLQDHIYLGFKEFCENTGVHAAHYFVKDAPIFQKIFFAVVMLGALGICFYLMYLQMFNYELKSIITSVKTTTFPIWKVAFPSIVICNYNVVMKQFSDNLFVNLQTSNIKREVFNDVVLNLSSLISADEFENAIKHKQIYEAFSSRNICMESLMSQNIFIGTTSGQNLTREGSQVVIANLAKNYWKYRFWDVDYDAITFTCKHFLKIVEIESELNTADNIALLCYIKSDSFSNKMFKNDKTKMQRVGLKLRDQIQMGFKEFCENTSVHGVRYLVGDTPLFQKIFFTLVILTALTVCFYLIYLQVNDYEGKSIITTLTQTAFPIWKVPFPSVIICNFNVVMKQAADRMKPYSLNETVFNNLVMNLSTLITADKLGRSSEFDQVYEILGDMLLSTDSMMSKLTQPCNKMLIECSWQSKTVPCEQLFQKVKTTYGFCCAFNYYGMNDVSNLVASKPKNTSYIVGGAGPALGLRVVLDLDREQYTSAIRPIYGLSVVVQSSIEFPEMSLQSHTIEVSEELTLSVTPKVFQSTESIRGMNINKRKCLFDNEGQLEWSDKYSYKTCISECKARAIFHYCDCWPYYYPRIRPRKICSLLDIPCLRKHKYNYSTLNKIGDDKELSYADNCSCHPQCNEVIYSLHSDRAKASEMVDFVKTNQSVLNVFYDTVGCHKTEKDVYNTWDRALSSVGGIIGLCIGGSIITIVEIIYFFCQSIMCTFQKKEKRNEVHNYNRQIYIHNVKPYFHKEPVTIFRH